MGKDHFYMTQSRFIAALSGLLFLFLIDGAYVRAADNAPQTRVVLIGIADYADKQIKPRPMAENDAKALYDLFTDKGYLGVEPDHIRLLLGKPDAKRKSEAATADNILKAARWLAESSKKDDLTIFAIIGEGAPLGDKAGQLCYLAADTKLAERSKTSVPAADLTEAFDKMRSRRFCAFVDVNFHGYKSEPVKMPQPTLTGEAYREFVGPIDKDDENPTLLGRAVYLANSGLTASPDAEKNGIFTQAIVEGLRGKADKDGYEADGVVTTDELGSYLEKVVPELAEKFGKTEAQKEQYARVLKAHRRISSSRQPGSRRQGPHAPEPPVEHGGGKENSRRCRRRGEDFAGADAQAQDLSRSTQGIPEVDRRRRHAGRIHQEPQSAPGEHENQAREGS